MRSLRKKIEYRRRTTRSRSTAMVSTHDEEIIEEIEVDSDFDQTLKARRKATHLKRLPNKR